MALDVSGLASAASKIAEQQAQPAPAKPSVAKEKDVAQFEQLMEGDKAKQPGSPGAVDNPQQVAQAQQTQQVEQVQPVQSTEPTGVVDQLSKTGEEINAKRQEILDRMASTKDLSAKDLLEMQFKLAELTMQQTMLGKAGEKGEQAVQQLFKG